YMFAIDTYLDSMRPVSITVPYAVMTQGLLHHLSQQGMVFSRKSGEQTRELMASFVEQLHSRKLASADSEPFGWSMQSGKRTGVVCFDKRFNCAGIQQVAAMD